MKIGERRQVGDVHVWAVDGGIDQTTHDEFVAEMQKALDAGEKKLVLDLGRLSYIGSLGLGTLVRLHSRFKNAGASLKFANLHHNIVGILKFTHLDRVFDLYDTVEHAVRAHGE